MAEASYDALMSTRSALEVERKYEFVSGSALPDLIGVAGIAEMRPLDLEELDATYYDTADLRLTLAGVTLRRRSGGRDAGWHLKLPVGGDTREEISRPAHGNGTTVPAELRALVGARARKAKLKPVVRLRTRREVRQLVDGAGRVLAEFADDRVTAAVLGDAASAAVWRELEIELVDGDEAVLDAVGALLQETGAVPTGWSSKLAHALGVRLPPPPPPPTRAHTAGDAVLRHLREQVTELVSRDPGVRRDAPDAVHKMRVATRRLRSALKTFRPVLDRVATDPVRAELTHLAAVLGGARDAEVLRDRLRAAVGALPVELVLGPVLARIDTELIGRHREAHARVVAELDAARYLALLDSLDQLLDDPPWRERAQRPARKELRHMVRRTWVKLEAAAAAAEAAPTAEQRAHLLHEARKTAKQVRYAAEASVEVLGQDARAFAKRVEAVQEALGEHQDSVVARARLRELGVVAHLAGENAFTFGLLYGLEAGRADRTEEAFDELWPTLAGKHSRWLR